MLVHLLSFVTDASGEKYSDIPPTSTTPRHKKEKKEAPAKAFIAPGLGESDRQIGPPPPMMNGDHRDEEVIQPLWLIHIHGSPVRGRGPVRLSRKWVEEPFRNRDLSPFLCSVQFLQRTTVAIDGSGNFPPGEGPVPRSVSV